MRYIYIYILCDVNIYLTRRVVLMIFMFAPLFPSLGINPSAILYQSIYIIFHHFFIRLEYGIIEMDYLEIEY